MQLKKTKKADLNNRRVLFLEIGLAVAIVAVIVVFGVSQGEKTFEKVTYEDNIEMTELIDLTQEKPQEQTQAKPTVDVISDVINVVKNDVKLRNDNFSFAEFIEDAEVVPIEIAEEVIEEEAPFLTAEEMPTFNGGGLEVFRAWVQDGVEYPEIARENGLQGTVVLSFVVERNGRVSNIEVLQTPDKLLSDAAIDRVSKSPQWQPARQRGQTVRLKYTLPIAFTLRQ